MLDLSAVKVVQKDWGQQVWLNDYEMLMVMNAGGETSRHRHLYHDSGLWLLSGNASIQTDYGYSVPLAVGDVGSIDVKEVHRVQAITDSIIYERYTPVYEAASRLSSPHDDIERLVC